MSDEELRDEMLTLLLAGHETTATALAWACGRLADHPDVAELAREEVRRILGDEPLRGERIGELAYVDAFAKETLRLNPILPDVGRRLLRPMTIGGWELPAGVVAAPSIYLAHRRPDVWPEPERFRPERFLGARPNAYAFFPFGGGLRRCLGMAFALYEMKVVLAELLRTARLRPVPGYCPTPVLRAITLAPSKGMMVIADRE